jgi:hypothetical protein
MPNENRKFIVALRRYHEGEIQAIVRQMKI